MRFNEDVVREYCDEFKDEMKGQAGWDLLKDFKDMHKNTPLFDIGSDEDAGTLSITEANDLQLGQGMATLIRGTLLGAHLEGTAHEGKLSDYTEDD